MVCKLSSGYFMAMLMWLLWLLFVCIAFIEGKILSRELLRVELLAGKKSFSGDKSGKKSFSGEKSCEKLFSVEKSAEILLSVEKLFFGEISISAKI